METNQIEPSSVEETRKQTIAKRIDGVGWALFFIMIGGIGLVPPENVHKSAWLIGVGAIMLGGNLARYIYGIKLAGFTLFLGILALGSGLCDLYGISLPLFPILLVLVGLAIVLGIFSNQKQNQSEV